MALRLRKTFPPGTFIPTPQRFIAIAQLCLAFSLMLWYVVQPFMGEYFALRSRMLLYEYIMGTSDILKNRQDQKDKLKRQSQRFGQLPLAEQQLLQEDYHQLQTIAGRSFFKKIEGGLKVLIQGIPPFEQAWIFFSITIAILILLKREGAKEAAWLLPLIVIAYAVDNQFTGKVSLPFPDEALFPTEEIIFHHYLHEPLASTPLQQKEQLERGWAFYLIQNWASQKNEGDKNVLEEAEFNFTLARLKLLHIQSHSDWLFPFQEKLSWFSLSLYFLWNGLFAWVVSRSVPQLPDMIR